MNTFKESDNLSDLVVGDQLIMSDGVTMVAVEDFGIEDCTSCAIWDYNHPTASKCPVSQCRCNTLEFHFEKVEP